MVLDNSVFQIRRGNRDDLRLILQISPYKHILCPLALNHPDEKFLLRDHNICFPEK